MKKKLGKVAFTYAGDYAVGKLFRKFDFVSSDNGSHVSLQENNVGHDLTDRAWWAPLADITEAKVATISANDSAKAASKAAKEANEAKNLSLIHI